MQGEAEVRGDVEDAALGQRPGLLPHGAQHRGGRPLDVGEVVVPLAHLLAQLGVRPAGQLRRRALLGQQPGQLAVQPDERLEGVSGQPPAGAHHRQAERRVGRRRLVVGQLDLQARAPARRLRTQQVLQRHAQRAGDRLQQAEPRLPLAVLDQGQL
jgi:hypothetical protein